MRISTFAVAALVAGVFRSAAAPAEEGAPRTGEPAVEVVALAGQPFGVGHIRVVRTDGKPSTQPRDLTYAVSDPAGRIHYPAFLRETVPGAGIRGQVIATGAWFLFRGDEPLTVTFDDAIDVTTRKITPHRDNEAHRVDLDRWWQHYQSSARTETTSPSGNPLVHNYAIHRLARRLHLEPPQSRSAVMPNDVQQITGVFLGTEELRLAMQQDRLLDLDEVIEPLDQPLPEAASPPPIDIPQVDQAPAEPLAAHVPAECFYVRFRTYSDFRRLRELVDVWGGNLRGMTESKSLDYQIANRLERQLALRETELAKRFGDNAIGEMAVIGADVFVREGAAIGILFQARQAALLSAAISAQRAEALSADKSVSEQTIEIAGRKVSLLSTPDNRVRSFYAVDGDFHLVTTSSTLVRRFFEAGAGTDALAGLNEFRWALSKQPAGCDDATLLYLSDPFIRLLVSPAYRVEMTRRMQADADLELVALARLAAASEQAPAGTIEELVQGGFLPTKFPSRPDGSHVLLRDGDAQDSLRGARRTFLPVLDVKVDRITKSEADGYRKFAIAYRRLYTRMDPVVAWIRQAANPAGSASLIVDSAVTPFTQQNLGAVANVFGPAERKQLAPIEDAILFAEANIAFWGPSHVFAGLLDHPVVATLHEGELIQPDWQSTPRPVFLGERGHTLRDLVLNSYREIEDLGDGFFKLKQSGPEPIHFGWRREDWSLVGGELGALRRIAPQLKLVEADRPAQVRVHVGDLARSRIAPVVQAYFFLQDRTASQSNARLLETLHEQLHVDNATALATAEDLLAAKLVCPLGGTYEHARPPIGYPAPQEPRWRSTAWSQLQRPGFPGFRSLQETIGSVNAVPIEYRSPFLERFQGLDVEVRFEERTLWTHFELSMTSGDR